LLARRGSGKASERVMRAIAVAPTLVAFDLSRKET